MTLFSSNCTLPHDVVTIVSQPNTRGTFDILWTCFATIFLCTWSSQHPNVPALKEIRKQKLKGVPGKLGMMLFSLFMPEFQLMKAIGELYSATKLTESLQDRFGTKGPQWSTTHSFFTNMGGFVVHFTEKTHSDGIENQAEYITTTGPSIDPQEVSVPGNTIIDVNSRRDQDADPSIPSTITELRESSTQETVVTDKSLNQSQDINCEMGIASASNTIRPKSPPTVPKKKDLRMAKKNPERRILSHLSLLSATGNQNTVLVQDILESLKQKAYSEKEGTGITIGNLSDIVFNLVRLRGEYWALDGPQLLLAQEQGIISQIPNVSTSNVEDRSSGDSLAKFLAVVQVGWQIIQLIIRWTKRLPTSQVEIVTVGFALCTLCTYLFYWKKPQGVQVPFLVQAKRYPTRDELYDLAEIGPTHMGSMYVGPQYNIPEHAFHRDATKNNQKSQAEFPAWVVTSWTGGLACALAFGCLHCAAWNFHFPTEIEQSLWRGSSLITSGLPIVYAARNLLWMKIGIQIKDKGKTETLHNRKFSPHTTIGRIFDTIGTTLYVGARLFLLVETIRSSFFLVPDTFLTSF